MKICITGDFLRPEIMPDGSAQPHQLGNIRWFSGLVRAPIGIALSEPADLYFPGDRYFLDPIGWAAAYDSWPIKMGELPDLYVGFEMPPCFIRAFNAASIPWINISFHPARYMPDLVFNVSATPEIQERIVTLAVNPNAFKIHAGALRAKLSWMPDLELGSFSLFTGQTWQDASLIEGGRFWGPADALKLLGEGPPIVFKPHPHDKSETATFGKVVDANVYRLMCQPGCQEVVSLSSSTLFEAEQFGVPTRRLMPKREGSSIPIYGEYLLYPGFWKYILAFRVFDEVPTHSRVTPNLIRSTLPHRWGDDILFK